MVTYNGTVDPSVVRLYSGGFVDSGDFGDYLNVTVDEGTAATYADCTGFSRTTPAPSSPTRSPSSTLCTPATPPASASGIRPVPAQSKTYQITVELDARRRTPSRPSR